MTVSAGGDGVTVTLAEYHALLARDMREDALVGHIVRLAADHGWRAMHQLPAMNARGRYRTAIQGHRGFPDLVLASRHGVIFVECKTETGSLEPDQRAWRDALQAAGADWRLWRPRDWFSGHIERVLEPAEETDR